MLTKGQAKRIDASLSLVDKETQALFRAVGVPGKSLKKIKANAIEAKKISQIAADMIVKSMKNKNDIVVASSYPAVANLHQKAVSMAARADLIIRAADAEVVENDEYRDLPEDDELDEDTLPEGDELVDDELDDDNLPEDDELGDDEGQILAEDDELDDELDGELPEEDDELDDELDGELPEEDDELDDNVETKKASKKQMLQRASVRKIANDGRSGKVSIHDKNFWNFV